MDLVVAERQVVAPPDHLQHVAVAPPLHHAGDLIALDEEVIEVRGTDRIGTASYQPVPADLTSRRGAEASLRAVALPDVFDWEFSVTPFPPFVM